MSANSLIQWTDHTFNSWYGCRRVAPECENCYIVRTVPFRTRGLKHGSERVRTSHNNWLEPYRWNKRAEKSGHRQRVFCLSLGDWLDDEVEISWLADLLEVIRTTPNLDWQLLTKRPQNFEHRLSNVFDSGIPVELTKFVMSWLNGNPPDNVWIGVSVGADQEAALAIPARVHFLSCEPMLRALNDEAEHITQKFDWIIFGGESGAKARECKQDWIRAGLQFCQFYNIPAFVKQLGAFSSFLGEDGKHGQIEYRAELKDSHGGDMSEWPEDLRVREFPKVEEVVAA